MKKIKILSILLILFLFLQNSVQAKFWAKSAKKNSGTAEQLGNEIQAAEYPDSDNVEPRLEDTPQLVIKAGVQEVMDISLDECLRYALGNNPKIQVAMQDIFAADSRVRQAWSSFFPQFSWQTGYTKMKQLQLSDALGRSLVYNYYLLGQISASEMLYDFGVTQNQVTIRKLDREGYIVTLTGTVNDVVCDVKKAFYDLQYAIAAKKVAEDSVKQYEAFYNQAKGFYKAGVKPKVDLTIAEVNLSNSKLALIQANNAIDIAMAKLNNAMGLPYGNQYKVSATLRYNPCDVKLDDAIEIARNSRPEFKLADIKVEETKQNVKLVKKSYFPTITIEGQYQIGGNNPVSNYGYNYGAYLNFPTINGMLIKNEIKEAKALHLKEESNATNTKNNIYLEIQQAYYSMIEKKNSIPVAFLAQKQARENYELSAGRYHVGVGNPIELKEAQVQYKDATLKYYNSLAQYNSARADLERSIGKNLIDGEVTLDTNFDVLNKKKDKKKK